MICTWAGLYGEPCGRVAPALLPNFYAIDNRAILSTLKHFAVSGWWKEQISVTNNKASMQEEKGGGYIICGGSK